MLKNDKWIIEQAQKGMITPFVPKQVREIKLAYGQGVTNDNLNKRPVKAFSYGVSSFGYDIRLSPKEFKIFRHIPGRVIDPKDFNPLNLETVELQSDKNGDYFIIPGRSYGLGVALERLEIPRNITVLCIGKSSYCRVGLIANLSPAEALWRGNLTMEFSNSSPADCRIYANEGIVQLLFLEGEPCEVSYEDRKGKYQNQSEQIITCKV